MTQAFTTNSIQETEQLGQQFASKLTQGRVVAFYGDLGAGKTAFVRGIMHGLGYSESITSPTFAIVNEYKGKQKDVAHFDMYRINTEDELYSTGYYDYLDGRFVLLIEWSENIPWAIESDAIRVTIEGCANMQRKISITGVDVP